MANIKFKKIKAVTLRQLKLKMNVEYYIKFTGAMTLGKEIPEKATVDSKTGEVVPAAKREPAHIAFIVNLETGEPMMMVCPTVLRKELEEAYAGEGYVGKCFGFVQTKVEGKKYNLVEIWEVAEPDDGEVGGNDLTEEAKSQAAAADDVSATAKGKKK